MSSRANGSRTSRTATKVAGGAIDDAVSTGISAAELKEWSSLSPFELKNELITLAQNSGQKSAVAMLNAGRGNPNWIAAAPREAFLAVGHFSLQESRRVWTADDLAGMPAKDGIHQRFEEFVQANPSLLGIAMLKSSVDYGINELGFDPDAWVHELADSYIGDNYPVPDRILTHCQEVVRAYIDKEMFNSQPPAGKTDFFAVEGGTAGMCYVFDSLMQNKILKQGDTIALMTPVFTPYLEIPELERFNFNVVHIKADMMTENGLHQWRYPNEELDKLADPNVKLLCLVNPSNPPSVELSKRAHDRIMNIIKTKNPNLAIVTDDVYGTFVEGFTSIAASAPRNTLLVYSFSKHYGCTGWRLGVIGLNQDNIFDEIIAGLPEQQKAELNRRYGSLTTEPQQMKFIDRMVADSRDVALNHTSGLGLPAQVQMMMFALFDLQERGQAYKQQIRAVVKQRLDLLLEGLGVQIAEDPQRAGYYVELDVLAGAKVYVSDEFADYLERSYAPTDVVFRLANLTSVVLLNGGGFDGPEWSVRVSLANLNDLDYLKIGHHLRTVLEGYYAEWQKAEPQKAAKHPIATDHGLAR